MTRTAHPAGAMMGATMIDRTDTEATLYRVAVSAFTYYPGKEDTETGYRVDEDIDWCAAPLRNLPPELLTQIRERIRTVITDPLADRRAFIDDLGALAST
ncbi:hypothetical protein [Microbacterium lacus]|uniref:Uncharacterized protein n=1 Tax=Microbacterium lacus TaxID=415217 RepID=A0ABN2FY44_9MICO